LFEKVGDVKKIDDLDLCSDLLSALPVERLVKRFTEFLGAAWQGISFTSIAAVLFQKQYPFSPHDNGADGISDDGDQIFHMTNFS